MRNLFVFLALSGLASAQQRYVFQRFEGQTILVPLIAARPVKKYIPPRPIGGVRVIWNPFVK